MFVRPLAQVGPDATSLAYRASYLLVYDEKWRFISRKLDISSRHIVRFLAQARADEPRQTCLGLSWVKETIEPPQVVDPLRPISIALSGTNPKDSLHERERPLRLMGDILDLWAEVERLVNE